MEKETRLPYQKSFKEKLLDARPWVLVAVVGLFACGIGLMMVEPPPPRSLNMATGSLKGAYHRYGQEYKEKLGRENIALNLVSSKGSTENLELLRKGEVQVAFVQSGTSLPEDVETLESLASLYLEPLWVFARKDANLQDLRGLKGKRVAGGPDGSGTRAVTRELLKANGALNEDLLSLKGGQEAAKALIQGTVDAAFFVTSPRAAYLKELLSDPAVELYSFHRHKAYAHNYTYLSRVVLSEGMVSLEDNLPDKSVTLIAPTATLVARKDLHPALLSLILLQADSIHHKGEFFEEPGQFPSAHLVDLPLSEDAQRHFQSGPSFLQRYLPFWAVSLLNRVKYLLLPVVTIVLPLLRFAPPLYRWRVRSKVLRWYEVLREVDQRMEEEGADQYLEQDIRLLEMLEEEVAQVNVPVSYMDELYELKIHLSFVKKQLLERAAQKSAAA